MLNISARRYFVYSLCRYLQFVSKRNIAAEKTEITSVIIYQRQQQQNRIKNKKETLWHYGTLAFCRPLCLCKYMRLLVVINGVLHLGCVQVKKKSMCSSMSGQVLISMYIQFTSHKKQHSARQSVHQLQQMIRKSS